MKPLSLKMRAIALLSQREHSRSEMRQKLLNVLRKDLLAASAAASASSAFANMDDSQETHAKPGGAPSKAPAEPTEPSEPADQVDTLLDWLEQQGYLSDARFVESRLHARSQRYGPLRIKQELAQHGLALDTHQLAELRAGEIERAKAIWQKKFGGQLPLDAATKAKQIRFMTARGFSADTVRKLLNARDDEAE